MFKRILESAGSAIFLSFLSFALAGIFSIISFSENGGIFVGNKTVDPKGRYSIYYEITNYKRQSLNDIIVEIPNNISLSNIQTSSPLVVKELGVQTANKKLISINGIPEESTVSLIIHDLEANEGIQFINFKEKKMEIKYTSISRNPKMEIFKTLLMSFGIYFILLSIQTYIVFSRRDKDKNERRIEAENLRIEITKMKDLQQNLGKKMSRSILLYKTKIYDFSIELSFWKNTIRAFLLGVKSDKAVAEQLFNSVTTSLKTYQANDKTDIDVESILYLTDLLVKKESQEKSV